MHVLFEYIELWGAYAGWVFGACGSAGSGEFCGPDAGEAPAGDSGAWGGPGQGGAGRGVAAANGRAGGQDSVSRTAIAFADDRWTSGFPSLAKAGWREAPGWFGMYADQG